MILIGLMALLISLCIHVYLKNYVLATWMAGCFFIVVANYIKG